MQRLTGIRDTEIFRTSLGELLDSFGGTREIHITENFVDRKHLCFVVPASPDLLKTFADRCGGNIFGEGVVFAVPWDAHESE